MSDIVWQDPPPDARGAFLPHLGRRQRTLIALKESPGKWCLYAEGTSPGTASAWQKDYPGVEAVTRSRPDGKFDIYVRWPVPS